MLFVRLNFLSLQNVFILLFNFFRIMRPLLRTVVVTAGVCLMRNAWKEDQHPSFINFISTFLSANSFRLNFVPIAPVIGSFCVFPLFVFFFFLLLSNNGSTLKYEELPYRTLYSNWGVSKWGSSKWPIWTWIG